MDNYKITWRLLSAIETPLHSDTIFGHLCWAIANDRETECLKEIDIGTFLKDMRQPRLLLSSAFPQASLPLPVISPPYEKLPDQLEAALAKRKLRKDAKKRKVLPLEIWQECRGDYDHSVLLERNERIQSLIGKLARSQEEMVIHNSINRITGTTVKGEASLYSEPATFYEEGAVFESYLSTDYFTQQQVETLFMRIELAGFGRNKHTGRGRFQISVEPWDPGQVEDPNAWLLISNMVPAPDDPEPLAYSGITKYGKLGGSYAAHKKNPFKKPLFMLTPGSVFIGAQPPTGMLVEGIHPDDPNIVQHAYAMCLGFKLRGGHNG